MRNVGEGFGGYMQQRNNVQTLSCCDDDMAWAANRNKTNGKKKTLALASIDN